MTDSPALKNPRVHVIMADGGEWDAQTLNPDLLRYERTAGKNGWAPAQKSPVQWLTFVAWRAGLREGHLPKDMTWERFSEEECLEVSNPGQVTAPPIPPELDTA